jgi:hypothetical protein
MELYSPQIKTDTHFVSSIITFTDVCACIYCISVFKAVCDNIIYKYGDIYCLNVIISCETLKRCCHDKHAGATVEHT